MRHWLVCIGILGLILMSGSLLGQPSEWSATNSADIEYRWQAIGPTGSRTCVLEFRDLKIERNYTTFDAAITYTYANSQTYKAHVIISTTENGRSDIRQCSEVVSVRVNNLQRQ